MNISFWGHNCFLIELDEQAILIDPWFSEKGAFFGSWHPWPSNYHLIDDLIARLSGKKVNVFISHEHQDHFDIETLEKLSKYCDSVLVPKYFDNFLSARIQSIGLDVLELRDMEEFSLDGKMTISAMIVDTGVNHDCAVFIKSDKKTFLNQNDCKVFDRVLAYEGHIDYYAVQFSGATWHPSCYDYDLEKKSDIARKKVKSKLMAIRQVVRKLEPTFFLPSAGPAVFPHLPDEFLQGDSIFVHQDILPKLFARGVTKPQYLRPGETLNEEMSTEVIAPPEQDEIDALKRGLPDVWENLEVEFSPSSLLTAVQKRLDEIKEFELENCPVLRLTWGAGSHNSIAVDLNEKVAFLEKDFKTYEKLYVLEADCKYFALMSDPLIRWQDLSLSFRARLSRSPDVFNTFINIFLSSDISNIKKAFETTLNISEERIIRTEPNSGKMFEFHRYCPHNGADLSDAEIDHEGNIICPRHAWKFKLSEGGNCKENDATIDAKEVEKTITLCERIHTRLTK